MKQVTLGLIAVMALGVSHAQAQTAPEPSAMADMLGAEGTSVGKTTFTQGSIGTLVEIEVDGLTPGKHGLHLHARGTCEHEHDYTTAEGHIDPSDKDHGYLNENGPEVGDLPNIIAGADGKAHVELFLPQIDIEGDGTVLLDADGSSLMIHEAPDDHLTQPIGGSGARVACGVIKKQ